MMEHDGVIDSNKAYSHKAIARLLGKTERWVMQNLLRTAEEGLDGDLEDPGVPARKVGNLYLVPGHELILWIERTCQPCKPSASK